MSNYKEVNLLACFIHDTARASATIQEKGCAELAEALVADGYRKPRAIATAEELDELPDGSILRGKWGHPISKDEGWHVITDIESTKSVYNHLPATLLHEGATS